MSAALHDAPARPDGAGLLRRAAEMAAAGRPGAARPLLAALERIGGRDVEVAELRARLAIREGRPEEAVAGLDSAIAAHPGSAALHRRRAEALGLQERYGKAARDAAEAVILDPADAGARAMLGVMLLLLGRLTEARACLEDALSREPGHVGYRQALAEAQERDGAWRDAERTLLDGVLRAPLAASLRTRLALLHARREDWSGVVETAEAARRAGAADAASFQLKGLALCRLGRDEEAGEAYREALKLAPEDAGLRHMAAMPAPGRHAG